MSRDLVEQVLASLQGDVGPPSSTFADELRQRFLDEALGERTVELTPGRPRRRRPVLLAAAALIATIATVIAVVVVPRPPSAFAIVSEARAGFSDLPSLRAVVVKVVPGAVLAEEVGELVPDWSLTTEISFQDDRTWRREIVRDENDPFDPEGQVGSFEVFTPEERLFYDAASGTASVDPSQDIPVAQSRLDALREMSPSLDQAAPVSDEGIRSCEVLSDQEIAGRDAHHLRCAFDAGDGGVAPGAEAWLDAETGVLLKLTFPNGLRFEVLQIEYDVSFPPGTFSTDPPDGSVPGGPGGGPALDTGVPLGEEVPIWTLPLAGGGRFELASLRGGWSVVYVWATWCGETCSGGEPEADPLRAMDEAFVRHGSEIGVVAIAVSDDISAVGDLAEREGYTIPMAVSDGPPADLWGGLGVPLLVVIDPDGGLAGAYLGDLQGDDVRSIVDAVVSGAPLPPPDGKTQAQLPN